MFNSATDAHWDPFVGASELLRLVFGEAFPIFDGRDGQGTPPDAQLSGTPLVSSSKVKQSVVASVHLPRPTRFLLQPLRKKLGGELGRFEDFIGVSEDSDVDVLALWQLKEKFRTAITPPATRSSSRSPELGAGASTAQIVSSAIQARDPQSSNGINDVGDGRSGKHQAIVDGWEPSDGQPLPLVNISFDRSILRSERPTSVISTKGGPRSTHDDKLVVSEQQGLRVAEATSKGGLIGPKKSNPSPIVAVFPTDVRNAPEPSVSLPLANELTSRQTPKVQNIVPTARPASHPSGGNHSSTTLPVERQSASARGANGVRKLHALVPFHLAKSITTNTMKAREDESVRMRLLQQESVGAPNSTRLSVGNVEARRTGNVGSTAVQHQSAGETKGATPNLAPETALSMPARTYNVNPTIAQAPVAVAHQVAISLPATNGQDSMPTAGISDHKSLLSAASQISALYRSQEQTPFPFNPRPTKVPARNGGSHLDYANKENTSPGVAQQSKVVQLDFLASHPLSASNMANTQPLHRPVNPEVLRDLKRAWSDTEVVRLDGPLQKKSRFA